MKGRSVWGVCAMRASIVCASSVILGALTVNPINAKSDKIADNLFTLENNTLSGSDISSFIDNILEFKDEFFDKVRIQNFMGVDFSDRNDDLTPNGKKVGELFYFKNEYIFASLQVKNGNGGNNSYTVGWTEKEKPGEAGYVIFPLAPEAACLDQQSIDLLAVKRGWTKVASTDVGDIPPFSDYSRGDNAYLRISMDGTGKCFGKIQIYHGKEMHKMITGKY